MKQKQRLDLHTILHAAAEIADSEGLEGVTLSSLAQKLGVRSPSLYNHVNGLDGLRHKMAIYGVEQLTEFITRAAIGKESDNAVRAVGEAYIAFARLHPGLYEATLSAPVQGSDEDEYGAAAAKLVGVVVQVFQGYGMDEETSIHTVRGFRSLLHGFASLERQGGFGLPYDLDVSLHSMIEIFLAGMEKLSHRQ